MRLVFAFGMQAGLLAITLPSAWADEIGQASLLTVHQNTDTPTLSLPNKASDDKALDEIDGQLSALDKLGAFYIPADTKTHTLPIKKSPNKATHQSCQGVWAYQPSHPLSQNEQIHALADYGYYDNRSYAELSGNVVIIQRGTQVRANKLTLDLATSDAKASGDVVFDLGSMQTHFSQTSISQADTFQTDIIGVANELSYNTQTAKMVASDTAFASTSLQAHGYAKQLTHDRQGSVLNDTSFSTCPPDRRVWQIDAEQITLNSDTGRAVAKNATFKIGDTPVFYLPYFNFSTDTKRASGFLTPKVGINSDNGIELSAPYYLNLAPNYDATITPTLYGKKPPKIAGEFRYLSNYGTGKIEGAYSPHNHTSPSDRFHLFATHRWQSATVPALSAFAVYRQVSDNHHLSDFEDLGTDSPLNLPRTLGVELAGETVNAKIQAETFQSLQGNDVFGNRILDTDRPYSRLPQLTVQYELPKILPNLTIQGTSDSTYFYRKLTDGSKGNTRGLRLYNQLKADYPLVSPWGYVKPTALLSNLYVNYDDSNSIARHQNVFVPTVLVESGLFFEKKSLDRSTQLLTPKLKYTYSPDKLQDTLPIFDTRFASMNYDQLLADSWVLGYDRLPSKHAITPAIGYTHMDSNGMTKFDMGIAQQFYLNAKQNASTQSGIGWRASVGSKQGVWADLSGSFTQSYAIDTLIAALRYEPSAGTFLTGEIIERRADDAIGQKAMSAIKGSAIFDIKGSPYQVIATTQYDRANQRTMETILGISYDDCCISASLYGKRHINPLTPNLPPEHSIMAQLRLNGLGGSDKLGQLLVDRIIGYK